MDGGALHEIFAHGEAVRPHFPTACVACPAARIGSFRNWVNDGTRACRFVKATIPARRPLPRSWAEDYAFALVRRGVIIRTRSEACAMDVAIDCAGPGTLVPWAADVSQIGFAATDVLVCLFPREGFAEALTHDPEGAHEIIEGMGAALTRVERYAEARGQRSAEMRVLAALSVLADTLSPPERKTRLPASFQQRDLAMLAAVRHESVCRVLGKLEREGRVMRSSDGLCLT